MLGEEEDNADETGDAGAPTTIIMAAGQIKVGGYVFVAGSLLCVWFHLAATARTIYPCSLDARVEKSSCDNLFVQCNGPL